MLDLYKIRKQTDQLLSKREFVTKQLSLEKLTLEETKQSLEHKIEAQQNLQSIAEAFQAKVHSKISSGVTRALKTVFGPNSYEFKIEFKRARGKTEAKLKFLKNGEEFDPKEEDAGGAIDVAAFALKVSCLMLTRPRLRRLIVSDEPFKYVNGEVYQERLAEFIQILAKEKNIQFVIVSDDSWLKIGRTVELE